MIVFIPSEDDDFRELFTKPKAFNIVEPKFDKPMIWGTPGEWSVEDQNKFAELFKQQHEDTGLPQDED